MMSHKNNSLSDHSDSFPMTRSMSGPNLASINKGEVALPEVSCTEIRPTISASSSHDLLRERSASKDDKDLRRDLFGKITGLLHKSLSGTRRNTSSSQDLTHPLEAPSLSDTTTNSQQVDSNSSKLLHSNKPVKETNRVNLEYDPINKRKVLNTYEILGNIGKGQHGKVKLAKDLEDGELVAIKIVDRKPRKERLKLRKNSNASPEYGNYESKIKREIAIMKRCHHKNIVRLKEVLDDLNSHKIYLVLEYLEKGEIRWKRRLDEKCNNNCDDEIPCRGREGNNHAIEEERDLLSNEYAPNLTFRQSRSIFRDVLLGLEYLHMHGIVHRDIKPANLLVSSENIVKISDFGVSFASSLNKDGIFGNELELAKTAGTPAFFAPELCQTNFSSSGDSRSSSANSLEVLRNDKLKLTKILPRIDHKIDIWALGVTFYAILFGRLPFNADSEFELFQVIVNESVQFPSDRYSFNSPVSVSEEELELAKDLLSKMLEKDSTKRIDIRDIKTHPFILMDLENEIGRLREFFFLNMGPENDFDFSTNKVEISSDEENNAVIGVGNRIRKQVLKTIAHHGMQNNIDLGLPKNDELTGSSSDDLTTLSISGVNPTMLNGESNRSVLLSEALRVSTPPTSSLSTGLKNLQPENNLTTHASSGLSNLVSTAVSRNGSYSLPSTREKTRPHSLWHDMFDSQTASSSRRGSASGPVEAPRIETKRNVVGDLYLKNQSAVDTFKGIQEQDDKRRRSSGVSVQHLSVNVERSSTPNNAVQVTSPIPVSTNRTRSSLNVEPISIDEHRPSPVISLPLNESFASLDSFSDEYLTYKYPDFKKQQAEFIQNYPEASTLDGINARFKNFNLKNSMHSKPPEISMHNYKGEEGEIEPKSSPFRLGKGSGSSISSSSSSTSSSGSEDENDDEEGNLTLAFSSKIAHPSRPPFLSMSQRSKSHDSNLPNLRRYSGNKDQDLPVVYQDGAPEFADIPTSLIPSVSSSSNTTSTLDGKRRHAEWEFFRSNDNSLSSRQHEETSKSSKEQRIQSNGDRETDHQRAYKRFFSQDPKVDSLREQFQNHYNKEPVKSSFPHALHLDNDKESRSKVKSRQEYSGTDFHNHNRSNTVTIGVLNRSRNNNKDS